MLTFWETLRCLAVLLYEDINTPSMYAHSKQQQWALGKQLGFVTVSHSQASCFSLYDYLSQQSPGFLSNLEFNEQIWSPFLKKKNAK